MTTRSNGSVYTVPSESLAHLQRYFQWRRIKWIGMLLSVTVMLDLIFRRTLMPSWRTIFALTFTLVGVQIIHHLTGLIVIPAQRGGARLARQISQFSWVQRSMPSISHAVTLLQRQELVRRRAGARIASQLQGQKWCLTTPDGIDVDAMVFGGDSNTSRGVIIQFNGNGQTYETLSTNDVQQLRMAGLTVILFNYGGVGDSGIQTTDLHETQDLPWYRSVLRSLGHVLMGHRGKTVWYIKRDQLITDAASVVSFAINALGFTGDRVILFGHSIGGAIAAETAAFFPNVHVCADRTFARLSDVAQFHVAGWACTPERAALWYATMARKFIWLFLEHIAGWEINTIHNWELLNSRNFNNTTESEQERRRLWILYHPRDMIIPTPAQLHAQLQYMSGGQQQAWHGVVYTLVDNGDDGHNRTLANGEWRWNIQEIERALRGETTPPKPVLSS